MVLALADMTEYYPLEPESNDLTPLPASHRQGLIAVAVLAGISFGSSATVLLYLTFKLIRWHITTRWRRKLGVAHVDLSLGIAERHFTGDLDDCQEDRLGKKQYPNQFLVLIYNLLLADLHQAAAFLLNAIWIGKNGIEVRNPACFAQGWLVSTGDLASSCFITAIAVHTYLAVVWHYRPPQRALYFTIVGLWIFDYLLAILGPITTHNGKVHGGFYVRAAAWCWVSVKYETHRLVLHYLFIFISLAITSALYILIFLSLRKRSNQRKLSTTPSQWLPTAQKPTPRPESSHDYRSDPENNTSSASRTKDSIITSDHQAHTTTTTLADESDPSGHHKAFLLYPVIYVVCTAPLALGRVATMAKADVPISYFCIAGALIGSNGWLDVLLWSLTRRNLLFNSDVGNEETGLGTFAFMRTPHDRQYGNIVWVEGATQRRDDAQCEIKDVENRSGRWRFFGWIKRGGPSEGGSRRVPRGRTISQESLNGGVARSVQQQHVERVHGSDEMPPMSGIHMDMITSVVVQRTDLEKERLDGGKSGILRYCKSRGMCKGDEKDLPVLQDPSGYLDAGECMEEVEGESKGKDRDRRFGT